MVTKNLLEVFDREIYCVYRDRHYLVRDNGSIMRIPKQGCKPSKWDNVWSFGIKDPNNGYMIFAGNTRVHQVVCTAFNGPATLPNMVVDHKDTNRCNNRPENLQWLTRLENTLNNPATRKKIIFYCGSVEAFIENPSILRTKTLPPNVEWMRTVTKEEAAACKKHIDRWAKEDNIEQSASKKNGIDEWIFVGNSDHNGQFTGFRRWKSILVGGKDNDLFPIAPLSTSGDEDVLHKYYDALEKGKQLIISGNKRFITHTAKLIGESQLVRVLTIRKTGERTPWYVFDIFIEDGVIKHKRIGYFGKNQRKEIQQVMHNCVSFDDNDLTLTDPLSDFNHIIQRLNSPIEDPYGLSDDEHLSVDGWQTGGDYLEFNPLYRQHLEDKMLVEHNCEIENHPIDSLTPRAKQLDWKTPTEFLRIPQKLSSTPLIDYLEQLPKGEIYCQNQYGDSYVYDAAMAEDGSHLTVATEIQGVTRYALSEVTFSDGVFIHKSIRTFFTEEGVQKYFALSLGREWDGGDVFEDYC